MPPLHRLQLSIDEQRLERVEAVAQARGSSIAAVIRDAIDIAFADDPERSRTAARRLLVDELIVTRGTKLRW
ncbi:MAG: ribbon-helix-helix protein, CopG family [Gaiellaceae bacterium]